MQLIYAVPSDREENTRYAAVVRDAILHVQDWYAEQLDGLTFAIEDPTPLICAVENPAEYYEGETRMGPGDRECPALCPGSALVR